jgi:uncharacterized protein YcbK (DUF882 family)
MNGPSKHLTWSELACKDGTPYPDEWRTNKAIELAEIFEVIRKKCGSKSIKILSAFRTIEHNKSIGGARNSQHIQGRALDLQPPEGYTVDIFYNLIKELSGVVKIRGIGKYKTFVHIDTRQSDRLVVWSGSGVKDSLGEVNA